MPQPGSVPKLAPPFSPWLAPLAVFLGVAAMAFVARPAARLGLRPAIVFSELALVAPGLLLALLATRGRTLRGGLTGLRAGGVALSVLVGATAWAGSLGLMGVQALFWEPPAGYLEAFLHLHEALRPRGPLDALASALTIAAAPAICEELLFRGLALPSLAARLGSTGAVVASSLLFGLIHLDQVASGVSLYRVPFAIGVGLVFGALRVRTGGLAACTIAHLTLNAITFATVALLRPELAAESALGPGALESALLFLAGTGATLALLRALSRR
jgi:membrane protease YdiL (CAAX protease family)